MSTVRPGLKTAAAEFPAFLVEELLGFLGAFIGDNDILDKTMADYIFFRKERKFDPVDIAQNMLGLF